MAWRHPGDKPLSEPMMVSLPTHICVTRPQWVINAYVSFSLNKSNICMACLHVLSWTFFNTITHVLEAWARFYSYHYYGNFVIIFMRGLMYFFSDLLQNLGSDLTQCTGSLWTHLSATGVCLSRSRDKPPADTGNIQQSSRITCHKGRWFLPHPDLLPWRNHATPSSNSDDSLSNPAVIEDISRLSANGWSLSRNPGDLESVEGT